MHSTVWCVITTENLLWEEAARAVQVVYSKNESHGQLVHIRTPLLLLVLVVALVATI